MSRRKPPPNLDLDVLLDSWIRDLRSQRKSDETLRAYRRGVRAYLTFCTDTAVPRALTKDTVKKWLDSQHADKAASVRLRLISLKQFAKWLADEEEFDADPILTVPPPKLSQGVVTDLDDGEIQRMLKACAGARLRDKRDRAMVLLFAEAGLRASEMLSLDIGDIDLDARRMLVHGKGDKYRRVGFSADAAAAIDRYVRARQRAVLRPTEGPLWISEKGNRLSYTGLVETLKARAAAAGVIGFHLHRFRHSAAVRWLRNGGSETGLQAHCGWTDRTMVARYTKAASEQLAAEEFDRLNLSVREL